MVLAWGSRRCSIDIPVRAIDRTGANIAFLSVVRLSVYRAFTVPAYSAFGHLPGKYAPSAVPVPDSRGGTAGRTAV